MKTVMRFECEELADWLNIFDYKCQRDSVGSLNGIKFVIHPKEGGHNLSHLHAQYQGCDVSLSIPDGKVLAGNLPLAKQKIAQKWVQQHSCFLEQKWDELVGGLNLVG